VARYVQRVRLRQPRIGTRKLHYLLHSQPNSDLKVGRDRLFEILAEHRLLVLPKRAYHKTTHSFTAFTATLICSSLAPPTKNATRRNCFSGLDRPGENTV